MKMFEDHYEEVFDKEDALSSVIKKMDAATTWTPGITSAGLKVLPISGPIEADAVAKRTNTSYEAAYSTADEIGAQLLLSYAGSEHLVRWSAMKTLFDTAKINGSSLNRLGAYKLSQVLNLCISVAKGSSLIMHRAEKVGAVLSDNANGYKIMPVPELMDITHDIMENDFGAPVFKRGFVNHQYVTATWHLPDKQDEFMDAYRKAMRNAAPRVFSANFMPAVMFETSDTSHSAATLLPHFVTANGGSFPLCDPIRVYHKRGTEEGVDLFRLKGQELFPVFMKMKDNVERLSSVVINHPQNAFIGLCNKADIPKKLASPALELFLQYLGDGDEPCMALDLYIGICEVMSFAAENKYSGEQTLKLMEKTAKVLRYNMEDFDLAGVVAWNNKPEN